MRSHVTLLSPTFGAGAGSYVFFFSSFLAAITWLPVGHHFAWLKGTNVLKVWKSLWTVASVLPESEIDDGGGPEVTLAGMCIPLVYLLFPNDFWRAKWCISQDTKSKRREHKKRGSTLLRPSDSW